MEIREKLARRKRLGWSTATGQVSRSRHQMLRLFELIVWAAIVLIVTASPALPQFNGLVRLSDTLGLNGGTCVTSTGLLPQLNPPAAVASCTSVTTGSVVGAPGANTFESGGAYPANGLVITEALVSSSLGYSAVSAAEGQIEDTYWPTNVPPNTNLGGILVRLSVHGHNTVACADASGGKTRARLNLNNTHGAGSVTNAGLDCGCTVWKYKVN